MSGGSAAESRFPNVRIHESSYVDERVAIGEGTRIWHFCHVLGDVSIGRHCSIGQNVMIGPHVTVGDNCKIQNNVSLYEGVTLEDDVFCRTELRVHQCDQSALGDIAQDQFRPTLVKRGATIGANPPPSPAAIPLAATLSKSLRAWW